MQNQNTVSSGIEIGNDYLDHMEMALISGDAESARNWSRQVQTLIIANSSHRGAVLPSFAVVRDRWVALNDRMYATFYPMSQRVGGAA